MEPTSLPSAFSLDLSSLNAPQRTAIETLDGPLLILAGPGSGKTRVVTHRIANLLQHGVPADQVMALTFTNKAADEMNSRVRSLAGGRVWISTFHRFCSRLLRSHAALVGLRENYSILDVKDSRNLLKEAVAACQLDTVQYSVEQIAGAISTAKNDVLTSEELALRARRPLDRLAGLVYPHYQRMLLEANAVDFDDLLLHAAVMLRENPELRKSLDKKFRYIMVDEYQDTNTAQYALVRALSIDYPNLAVTGDPDQSIYGWRGANLSNILDFEKDFPEARVVRLEQNYRSTPNILRVADELIRNNTRRKQKDLFTEKPDGAAVRLVRYPTHTDEAMEIAGRIAHDIQQRGRSPREIAILYRTHSLSRALEQALMQCGIAYQVLQGAEFYQRKEVKDILSYLHLLNNPQNNVAFLRVINTPPRGIGKRTLERLQEYARPRSLTLLEAARHAAEIDGLSKRAAKALAQFVAVFDQLRDHVIDPVEEIMGRVLAASKYRDHLEDSENEEDQERLANVDELLNAAREFDESQPETPALEAFLERVSLVSDTDDWETERGGKVSLMTLHSAKGLEFAVVYIMAVEQGYLPHERNRDDPASLEEERRLLFVGVTRAKEELQLSLACKRPRRGAALPAIPSNFLMELPRQEMEVVEPAVAGPYDEPHFHPPARDPSGADQRRGNDDELDESFSAAGSPLPPETGETPRLPASLQRVLTAAELAGKTSTAAKRVDPELFQHGMVVTHPDYGSGTVVALSGAGGKRMASVRFFGERRERRFRLAYSALRPVATPDDDVAATSANV